MAQGATPTDAVHGPELVIGLVGAVGTDLKETVVPALTAALKLAGYACETVRLSQLIRASASFVAPSGGAGGAPAEDARIDAHMEAGDALRQTLGRGDAVALLGLGEVRRQRAEKAGSPDEPVMRQAYIFDSLKHPGEVQTLRRIYGHNVFVLSAYTPREERSQSLARQIAGGRGKKISDVHRAAAERLIAKDQKAPGTDLGQNVRDTFPLADYFVRVGKGVTAGPQVERFVELVFGAPFVTPTRDEAGMYLAKAAALRSSDLSRQVGAVVMRGDGSIVAQGCNEVPVAGGGNHWEGDDPAGDNRDFRIGHDATSRKKEENLAEMFALLKQNNWLKKGLAEQPAEDLIRQALYGEGAFLKDARATNVIEYGRIVHAEMNALSEAARHGLAIGGATLYSTTFPCHMCARHIIAAGIIRVVYVEPYPKSLAKELYGASIRVEEEKAADETAVAFEPFLGVSPGRYADFFGYRPRKDDRGRALKWSLAAAQPRLPGTFVTYPEVEAAHMLALNSEAARSAVFKNADNLIWLADLVRQAVDVSAQWSAWKRRALEDQVAGD